jgi:hypothetical protein
LSYMCDMDNIIQQTDEHNITSLEKERNDYLTGFYSPQV